MGYQEFTIEGRNAVIEAYRAGKPIDKLFILDGCQDGPMMTIKREAKKHDTLVKYVTKERLDQLSETGKHQGVIAYAAAYEYAEVDDILEGARKKGNRLLFSCWITLRIPTKSGSHHPYRQSGRSPRCHYSEEPCGGTDRDGGKDFRRSIELYAVAKVTNLARPLKN